LSWTCQLYKGHTSHISLYYYLLLDLSQAAPWWWKHPQLVLRMWPRKTKEFSCPKFS
jgi:hypothetical protein